MFDVQLTFIFLFFKGGGGLFERGQHEIKNDSLSSTPTPLPLGVLPSCHLMRLESDSCLDVYNMQCEVFLS